MPTLKDLPERIYKRIQVDSSGCWVWRGATNDKGYGQTRYGGSKHRIHRFIYEWITGMKIGDLTIDHLCGVRSCCNPDHLEAVSNRTNILRGNGPAALNSRKTHCTHGHPLSGTNLRWNRTTRVCKTCANTIHRGK